MISCFSPKLALKPSLALIVVAVTLFGVSYTVLSAEPGTAFTAKDADRLLYDRCEDCHNDYIFDGNWSIEDIDVKDIAQGHNLKQWEAILKSVSMGDMP
ncbi:MAG: hypothetical protein GY923_15590, partial [Aestuariibacter sp.]|nr:hypothetical protein [Aestuariibacter sp.]MCP4948917.1 hypothetical protein [Aestuariibacter sp.]